MRAVLIATMTGTLLLLSGCGQKGPLYIPQQAIPQDSQPSKSSEDRSATRQTSLDDSN
jgi:predicted small lipoprotein YifL